MNSGYRKPGQENPGRANPTPTGMNGEPGRGNPGQGNPVHTGMDGEPGRANPAPTGMNGETGRGNPAPTGVNGDQIGYTQEETQRGAAYQRREKRRQHSGQVTPGVQPPAPGAPAPPPIVRRRPYVIKAPPPARRWRPGCLRPGCILPALILGAMLACLAIYALAPGGARILLLGIDYTDPAYPEEAVARSDSIMLVNIETIGSDRPRPEDGPLISILRPYVGVLSVPRDLWVSLPGVGENRINTAHFYAESQKPGSGPAAVQQAIALNFGLQMPYYLRIRFEGFRQVVDALGGVDISLDEPMAGYAPGRYHLTGRKALAFVRHRADSDDFQRMSHGQFMLKALFKNLLNPLKWPRLPGVWKAFQESVDTNIPAWMWPRLGLTLLRAGPHGIDSRVIDRTMVEDFMTNEGAMVLRPNWAAIHSVVQEMFGN